MANVRFSARSIVLTAGLWLGLTAAACEPSPPLGTAPVAPAATAAPVAPSTKAARTPTTVADATALARALATRIGPPAGGYRTERDAHGRLFIKTGQRLGNVTVVGRAADGSMVSGCVSSPEHVSALLGQGR